MKIDINDLTLGQLKEIFSLSGVATTDKKESITDSMIGRYVIVRSRNEGINAGFLKAADETGCIITEARRIWYHKPADSKTAWYEGVAQSGLSDDSKVSYPCESKAIIEDYSITLCTDVAMKSIRGFKSHESN